MIAQLGERTVRRLLECGDDHGHPIGRHRCQSLGFELDDAELNRVFEGFKALADRKKELFDGDIEALVLNAEGHESGPWTLQAFEGTLATGADSTAAITLKHSDGREVMMRGAGDGPVDAAYKAVEAATGISLQVRKFEVRALTIGEDAQGETVVYADFGGRSYRGAAVSTNIVEASVTALLEVINRIELAQRNAQRVS